MTSSPPGSRINRSPSPALPPPPSSAGLPPRPAASTTSHVGFSRQSLGPSSAVVTSHINPPGSARNFSGPARSTIGGGRPVSEILGGGGHGIQHHAGGGPDPKSPEAEAIDRWFQDLASYEVTLEEMAAASLDQNFTEELSAIEQWFRVLSEAERTAALYSLLQHSTQVQIRFFMTVLQQMARSDPMAALLSPATGVGGSMQAQMEAKLAGLSLRSPNNRTSFGAPSHSSKRDSFGGAAVQEQYLTPESALANAGEGPAAANSNNASPPSPAAAKTTTTAANNKASNRISAPGTLNSLNHSWMGGPQLDQVLERGPSPSGESVSSARSGNNNHHDAAAAARPKSTDFTGLANGPPGSAAVAAFARSPRLGEENSAGGLFPLSPAPGNWANMVNTPAVPMFQTNHSTIQEQAQAQAAAYGGGPVPKLSEAPKRRTSGKSTSSAQGQAGNNIYNEHGELAHSGQNQPGRGLQSPGLVGGGFQGPGAGTWGGVRSPSLGGLDGGFGGSANNFGLGVGGLGAGLGLGGGIGGFGAVSPSPSDIAFQMSQLQLQQLQLQQLQQLQQLGVAGAGGLGMGLPGGGLLGGGGAGGGGGYGGGGASGGGGGGGYGGLGMGSAPRHSSSSTHRGMSLGGGGIGGGKRSPMLSVSGGGGRSPSLGGLRRESGAGGSGSVAAATEEDTDIRVLEDVPQWLRTLRLHKYTTNFENHKWRDMVVMTDADLEANGVAALGARRKLLKTFESVRAQMGIPEPTGSGTSANKDTPDAAAAKDGASAAGAAAEDEE